ncbi:MAG: hypothetical protein ACI8XC_003600 [Gammaproteobacteria bacterium]|jgi:uncharacterized protein YPO0396
MSNSEFDLTGSGLGIDNSPDLFPVGQIRLSELSVYNWGSFNKLHSATIDSQGTLVTGDNGAGKSTFIDGLMALLLPAGRATFNVAAAQGDRSDRTLLSYMRGSFGSMHDGSGTRVQSKREGPVVTGLRALYRADDGSIITLAALFWTTQSSNALSDVKRVYITAKRNLSLKEVLDAFGEGNARTLKQWLKSDSAITCCDDSFSDYQELYRKLLFMENKNAPALLARALGLKKIDDLTALIRELVLEPSTVRVDARKVVDEFSDLVAIHAKLIDTRAQRDHLARLPDLSKQIKKSGLKLDALMAERNGLQSYLAEICHGLWQEKIALLTNQLKSLELEAKQVSEKERDAEFTLEGRHEDYIRSGGGHIESLKKEVDNTQLELTRVIGRSSNYQADARALKLDVRLVENQFIANQSQVEDSLVAIKLDNRKCQDLFGDYAGKLSEFQQQQKSIDNEIREIEARPDSNIDVRFQRFRDELVGALELDSEQCVFIGELIDVLDQEKAWQGAVERALGGLRTTLAVPESSFSMVTGWLNRRHTGLHIRVQAIRDIQSKKGAEFKPEGFLRKLGWRQHPYREWLKRHLTRFDLQCVPSTEMLDKTPYSMTQQGLENKDKGRVEKKDQNKIDDRRHWYLGFSNKSRLGILRNDRNELVIKLEQHSTLLEQSREQLDGVKQREALWQKMKEYRWEEINAPYWQSKSEALLKELQSLEISGSDLDIARQRWQEAKQALSEIRIVIESLHKKEGELSKSLADAEIKLDESANLASIEVAESIRVQLMSRVGQVSIKDLDQISARTMQLSHEIERELEVCRDKKNSAERSAISIMSAFRAHEKWSVIALDWRADISSLDEYVEHLHQIEADGLPQLVEQFVERLNNHATQSLARIRQKLESEREEILERIETINRVLKRTEFRPGSHLKLGAKIENYPHVVEFKKQVTAVLSQITSKDHEARFHQLAKVVDILDKASNTTTYTTLESLRLLDPRHQMSFYAEELDSISAEVRDVLESSSGKSGGEKESFAGTIVAASLAYVLTPDGFDRPVYCTVFLDEAFSNTAEAVSRRVLRVFKELHIHVNLITPFKNLNLARESARSLLIAERNQEQHESHLCEVTWEEVDRKLAEQRQQQIARDASMLGVEIDRQHA